MKKESKKKVKKSNKNNIFSPRNLLIGFIVIIILLLIFNYFYPVFSINNKFFNQNYNNGRLYANKGEPTPTSGDYCKNVVCSTCQTCDKNTGECVNVPNSPGQQCKITLPIPIPPFPNPFPIPGSICYGGKCYKTCNPDKNDCPVGYVCDKTLSICEKSVIVNPPGGSDHEPPLA